MQVHEFVALKEKGLCALNTVQNKWKSMPLTSFASSLSLLKNNLLVGPFPNMEAFHIFPFLTN